MKKIFWIGFVCAVVGLLLALPTYAQDEGGPEMIPVSGTINYSPPEILSQALVGGETHIAVSATGEWSGDFVGTDTYTYRVMIEPSGAANSGSISEFEGTILGDYEGTVLMWSNWRGSWSPLAWQSEWWILSGTGDLANIYGKGFIWGPGESGSDYQYSGNVFFVPPAEE